MGIEIIEQYARFDTTLSGIDNQDRFLAGIFICEILSKFKVSLAVHASTKFLKQRLLVKSL